MKTRNATVSFKTVGCRLNQAETAMMRASFEEAGYKTVPFGEKCDVCVIHGCVVTAKAEEDGLRLARSVKRRYPEAFVVLAGCAAELMRGKTTSPKRAGQISCHPERSVLLGRIRLWRKGSLPHDDLRRDSSPPAADRNDNLQNIEVITSENTVVDYLAGQNEKYNLPAILSQGGFGFERETRHTPLAPPPSFSTKRAIVKVQDGCDCRCAYCIVPSVRGPSKSRPVSEIIDEITRLTLAGFTEIVLTGANIGCFTDNECKLPQLLEKVEAIPTLRRFRISSLEIANAKTMNFQTAEQGFPDRAGPCRVGTTSYRRGVMTWQPCPAVLPEDGRTGCPSLPMETAISRQVIDFMASSKKMCFFLHLPLQSGSDKILKTMGRPYSAEQYCSIVDYAQKKLGVVGLGTDIIVGFPGETDDDFKATEQIVKQLPFSNLHVFSYSPRPGTPAASMPAQVSKKDKDRRSANLIELGRQKRSEFAKQFVGRRLNFVVEKIKDGWAEGWTGEYFRARFRSPGSQLKQIVEFVCERAEDDVLLG